MKRLAWILSVALLVGVWSATAAASPITRVVINGPGIKEPIELKHESGPSISPLEPEGRDSKVLGRPAQPAQGAEPLLTLHRYYASGFEDILEYYPGDGGEPGRFKATHLGPAGVPWRAIGWYWASETGEQFVQEVLKTYGPPAHAPGKTGGVAWLLGMMGLMLALVVGAFSRRWAGISGA